ncbi:hypothetical protein NFI96_010670 [Prochilodus magdalenae]|nr:hypothetical protein NFI96_010670 [Prochilodus magdalenae]
MLILESFIFFWDTFRLQRPSFNSVLQWWDLAKIQTKVFGQQYSQEKAQEMETVELQNLGKIGQKRFMHAVRTESGDLLSEPAEIRKRTVSFFSKLYNSEQSGAPELEESFLHRLPKLTQRSAETLDRVLSLDELYTALQGMENGRVPGIAGLPVEFYKSF